MRELQPPRSFDFPQGFASDLIFWCTSALIAVFLSDLCLVVGDKH
jgi:hypothetical protein